MKKLIISLSVALTVIACSCLAFTANKHINKNSFLKANVEALSETNDYSYSTCYNDFEFSLIRRVLVCISCDIHWGKGLSESGICVTDNDIIK